MCQQDSGYPVIPSVNSCPVESFSGDISVEQRVMILALRVYGLPFPRSFVDETNNELVTVSITREPITDDMLAERERKRQRL